MNHPWELSTHDFAGSKESIMRRGNVYQIANGYMGYRGTLDEFGPEEAVGVTLAGIFDRVGSRWREPINAPNGGFTRVEVDGKELTAVKGEVNRHQQKLYFNNAVFERETVFTAGAKTVTLRSTRFLSAENPHLAVFKYSVTCDEDAEVMLSTGIDCNIWDLNGPHLGQPTTEHKDTALLVQTFTQEMSKPVLVTEAVETELNEGAIDFIDKRYLRVFRFKAEAGKTYTICKFSAVFTDNDHVPLSLAETAITCVLQAKAAGYDNCFRRHTSEWNAKWERSDVMIDGDEEAQHSLRYSILQLLMVAPVAGSANSIPARALSGQVYKGAIFWDTEMFMFPFFLYTYPEKAVELLRYRIKTLDGARRKAKSEGPGYRGAFYAWESQDTGDDACSYFNIGDPVTGRELRTYFRDKQVHISGDIAIAMWEYFKITGDDSLLIEGGAEVILECARFYYSYAYYKKTKARYEILDVVGPDEYHERVNNNAFTSCVAKETFVIANATVDYLQTYHPELFSNLVRKLDIGSELPYFAEAAVLLYLPAPDPRTGIIEQFDGYAQLKETTIEALKSQMIHPHEYLGAGQGLAAPTQIIKQADVIMMLYLFRTRYSTEIKKANWEYYESRTEHGSSLSACAYAIVATECGRLDFAAKYFLKTAKIDIEAKYKVFVGTIFMGGSHPAANGGAWMTAVFGFGGVSADEHRVTVNPRLCPSWNSLQFRLSYKGDTFVLHITKETVTITPHYDNKEERLFVIGSTVVKCGLLRMVRVEYQATRDEGPAAGFRVPGPTTP